MKMSDKIEEIKQASSDLEYLKEEYERITLWASRDGDVEFCKLMEWLGENDYIVEHMIKVANKLKEL